MTETHTRCDFVQGAFACALPANHPGAHYGEYTEPADAAAGPQTAADDLLEAVFGAVLEGKSEPLSFYALGDDPEAVLSLTADKLDKALTLVRLSEKWDERAAFELLPELHRSTYFSYVFGDFVTGSNSAEKDPDGKAYYLGQLCLRLLSAGYLIGTWEAGGQ